MEFIITEYKHCDLIEITGRIDSYTAPKLDQMLKSLIADNQTNFAVDLSNVTYISSSGILVFVNTQKKLTRQNRGEIVFTNVPKLVLSSFELAGFNTLFTFYDNPVSAVGRF